MTDAARGLRPVIETDCQHGAHRALRLGVLLILVLVELLILIVLISPLIEDAIQIIVLARLASHAHPGKEICRRGRIGPDKILCGAIAADIALVARQLTDLLRGLHTLCTLLTAAGAAKVAAWIRGRASQTALAECARRRTRGTRIRAETAGRTATETTATGTAGSARCTAALGKAIRRPSESNRQRQDRHENQATHGTFPCYRISVLSLVPTVPVSRLLSFPVLSFPQSPWDISFPRSPWERSASPLRGPNIIAGSSHAKDAERPSFHSHAERGNELDNYSRRPVLYSVRTACDK